MFEATDENYLNGDKLISIFLDLIINKYFLFKIFKKISESPYITYMFISIWA